MNLIQNIKKTLKAAKLLKSSNIEDYKTILEYLSDEWKREKSIAHELNWNRNKVRKLVDNLEKAGLVVKRTKTKTMTTLSLAYNPLPPKKIVTLKFWIITEKGQKFLKL